MRISLSMLPVTDVPSAGGPETAAHRELKRLALEWALTHRLALAAEEVRLPRSGYRADVAAATPRILSDHAFTAVFECKVSRANFLRDSAPEAGTRRAVVQLSERLMALRSLIAGHQPDLRRGDELFPEFEAFDLRGLRHDRHDQLETELRVAQRKLRECTKFEKLARWRSASLLYLVAEDGLFAPFEVPEGWGLMVRRGATLELVVRPCLRETTVTERVAFVERIAAVAARHSRKR